MTLPRVLILGGSGCLGSSIASELLTQGNYVIASTRSKKERQINRFVKFNVGEDLRLILESYQIDFVINCIVEKQNKTSLSRNSTEMIKINSLFPRQLSVEALKMGIRVIHISTDSVFFGIKGNYKESSLPLPTNLYSLSKLIGEPGKDNTKTIRLSFVPVSKKSALTHGLFSWLINDASKVPTFGYSNVYWNGVTDKIAGTIVANIVNNKILFANMPQLIHLYSRERISKYDLALMLLQSYSLSDTHLSKKQKRIPRDFTLATKYDHFSQQIWESLGFSEIPSIKELLK